MPEPVIRYSRLKIVHRTHTGRKLHKSHTSYPLLAALLLMVGVLLTATTLQVRAADVVVTAVANGPAPAQAAVILSPVNDDRFTDSSVPVSGTCDPGYYIKLFRNNIFSGAALCTAGGTFSIVTDLFLGRNDLQARTFNIADHEGPPSNVVTVYYDLPDSGGPTDPTDPTQPGTPPYQPGGKPDPSAPFYLATEYFFKAAYTGQKITWDFEVFGGKGPYTAYAVWGDGYSDRVPLTDGNKFTLNHTYNSPKEVREYYSLTVRVVDSQGFTASLQLIAIMNDPNIISGALVRPNDPSPLGTGKLFSGVLKFVWSAYGILLLMGICFWLGERRGESVAAAWYRRRLRRKGITAG